MSTPEARLATLLILTLTAGGARGEVVRHDVDAGLPATRGAAGEFAAVGRVLIGDTLRGTGTLVRARWVLTSAHVAADRRGGGAWAFALGGRAHEVAEVIVHPRWTGADDRADIALMRLAAPVTDVKPIDLLRVDDAVGTPVWLLGFGWTGNGEEGITHWDGRRRAVSNVIESHVDDAMLLFFDPPGSGDETALEGMAGFNDSGGPVLVETGAGWRIAGIHTFIADWNGSDVLGDYGDVQGATRVARHRPWLERILDACPEDLDRNGAVEVADLLALLRGWGPCERCAADIAPDGAVDLSDLFALFGVWGPCPPPPIAPQSVSSSRPENTSGGP